MSTLALISPTLAVVLGALLWLGLGAAIVAIVHVGSRDDFRDLPPRSTSAEPHAWVVMGRPGAAEED